jgi:hypothetical protein
MGDRSSIHRYVQRSARLLGITAEEYLRRREEDKKWCGQCKAWHQNSEFGADRHTYDGLTANCLAAMRVKIHKPHAGGRKKGSTHSAAVKQAMAENRSGHKNANWKGGVTPITRRARQHAGYVAWRKAVIARDHNICRRCGTPAMPPHAHHVKSFKQFPQLGLDLNNGITLCGECHRAVHAGEKKNGR